MTIYGLITTLARFATHLKVKVNGKEILGVEFLDNEVHLVLEE